jgi:hypothetical protein
MLSDGGRGFDFSCAQVGIETLLITVEAPIDLFTGPDRIALQEGAGICYETLKLRVETDEERPPSRFTLQTTDVAQHRKSRNHAQAGRAHAGRR